MKTLRIWRNIFIVLVAFSLTSCNDDDDDKVSNTDAQRALFELKKDYTGELKYGLKDENFRTTIENVVVKSAEDIRLDIPLDLIAEQVKDETIAQQIREWKTAQVRATYQFKRVDNSYFSFNLYTEMVPDERFAYPITRTSVVVSEGLQLIFNNNYTGAYQHETEALTFNLCVDKVLINNEPLENFKPIVYSYGGNARTKNERVL
ncbi:MAG: hypothetical protein K6E54_10800 [Bacteroidaceae bacterium]|nr:hypothetical protein [Bacteroidaceae bacterium]